MVYNLIRFVSIFLLIVVPHVSFGQFYLRGDVRTEKQVPLQNAKIFLHTSRTQYFSGPDGSFGIIMKQQSDSVTVSLEGYEPVTLWVRADTWQKIVLKTIISKSAKNENKLISLTLDKSLEHSADFSVSDETYFKLVENDFISTAVFPHTGYSLNVNKASYSNVRRFINGGSQVPPDAVRIEEMINYFNLPNTPPEAGNEFSVHTSISSCPWKEQDRLLFIHVNARTLDLNNIAPANFVFLIDISGSMDDEKKLPLVQAAFQLFVKNIRPIDTVSIVTYGGGVLIKLPPTSGAEKHKIINAIEELYADGDTPGEAALQTAYKLAERTFNHNGNNRIILATDGDFNVGETAEKELEELVTRYKNKGIYLTCLGVGQGNFKDSKLQVMAKKGNGNYAYLDDLQEAEKTLVTELTQTMYAIADNALMDVEFNPAEIKQYRLIGFDNRRTAINGGENILEGGEVGSGSSILTIFQYTPVNTDTLPTGKTIANLNIRYNQGRDTTLKNYSFLATDNYSTFEKLAEQYKFATAVTAFGLKLKKSDYAKISWDLITSLSTNVNASDFLQTEFATLVEKARNIYEPPGKKKKRKKK
jgi:Ca-activated chloride channel family protein